MRYRPLVLVALGLAALGQSAPARGVDGVVDPSFGGGGFVRIPWDQGGGLTDWGRTVAVQPDGRIVLAGYWDSGTYGSLMGLVRLLPDGALDPSFGNGGRATYPVWGDEDATGIAFGPTGNIYVAGKYQGLGAGEGWPILRWFDAAGAPLGDVGIPSARATFRSSARVAMTAAGNVLFAYSALTGTSGGTDFYVRRYDPWLGLDTSFGSTGEATVGFDLGGGLEDELAQMLVQPDGKILLAGSAEYSGDDWDVAVTRLTSFGLRDACCFGSLGRTTVALDQVPGGHDEAHDAALQADGRIVVVGQTEVAGSSIAGFVIRFRADGSYDQQFGLRLINPAWAALTILSGVAMQSDGRIVVVGHTTKYLPEADMDFFAARLLPDGSLDPTFNGTGVVGIPFPSNPAASTPDDWAEGVALQAGRPVIVGSSEWSLSDTDWAVVRLQDSLIFADGFETGSTAPWSAVAP